MLEYLLLTPAQLFTHSFVLTAFAVAVSIAALSHMAGELFSMPSIKGFARAELRELGVSAVILIIIILLIIPGGPFDMVARGFMLPGIPQDQACNEWKAAHGPMIRDPHGNVAYAAGSLAFAQADYFLGCKPGMSTLATPWATVPVPSFDGVVMPKLGWGYFWLMMNEMFTGFLSGFHVHLAIDIYKVLYVGVGIMPWIGLTPINMFHTFIVDLVGNVFAAFMAQKMLLEFVDETMLSVFLPIGLLMRVFPFSRRTGSTIIALVLAAYFVFPTTILINQQIWEMVANPQGTDPNCAKIGDSCSVDKGCCSYDCRAGRCVSPLTDFTEYTSIYSLCHEEYDETGLWGSAMGEAQTYLSSLALNQEKFVLDTYFTGSATTSKWTKTQARSKEALAEMLKRGENSANILVGTLLMPLPGNSAQLVFSSIEVLIIDVSQFALLAIIFVVLEIVITMTLFKDFALLIGGEPRLFGLGKLV